MIPLQPGRDKAPGVCGRTKLPAVDLNEDQGRPNSFPAAAVSGVTLNRAPSSRKSISYLESFGVSSQQGSAARLPLAGRKADRLFFK